MSQIVFYLDLDRTLYKTSEAAVIKWQVMGELYDQVDASYEHDRQGQFYRHDDQGSYSYDFTAQLKDIGLDPAEVYPRLRGTRLSDGRLEYDGVKDLIDELEPLGGVAILTYGVDDYQRFKASLCPSISGIEVITTLGEKGDYLQDKGDVWLVDDKPLGDKLPENVSFIQVLHGQDVTNQSWPVVSSLAEIGQYLKK